MAQKEVLIGTAMSMLKKCTCVAEWNSTRDELKENMPDNKFDAFFSVIESTGFIVKVLGKHCSGIKDDYGIKLVEYYIKKNIADIIANADIIAKYNKQ